MVNGFTWAVTVAVVLGLVAVAKLFYIAGVLSIGSPDSMDKAVPMVVLAGLGTVLVRRAAAASGKG
jgi:hypothetical protein